MKPLLLVLSRVFYPELISTFREGYTGKQFLNDLIAGVIVGIVALPLAIAFGIASLGPGPDAVQRGVFTAIIAGFIISCLSGSRVQIGGPTGAFIVIVFGIVADPELGLSGLIAATVLSGILLVIMGICGLGKLIKYIPYPVTLGFTAGIAVTIAASQLQMFFGINLEGETLPGGFLEKMFVLSKHLDSINAYALAMSVLSIAIILLVGRLSSRIPGSLVAVIVGTALVALLNIPVDTIGQPLGGEPVSLEMGIPVFTVPEFRLDKFSVIFSAAVTIALLGAIESLLSAVVADSMIGTKHRSNTELIAQGVANIVTPFFGGIPATGAIARTATNIKNGGRTPVAGIVHAITLLIIVLCLGPYAAMIPMPVLAGILMVVAINMSHYHVFVKMFRAPKSDLSVMLLTFSLTVLLDLTVAIPLGLMLAAFLFMHRTEKMFTLGNIAPRLQDPNADQIMLESGNSVVQLRDIPQGVRAYDVSGPFFFGTAGKFQKEIDNKNIHVLVLRMKGVPFMDVSGLHVLEEMILQARNSNTTIVLSGLKTQPMKVITRFGLIPLIGEENIHNTVLEAVFHAENLVRQERERERQSEHDQDTKTDTLGPTPPEAPTIFAPSDF